MCVEARCENVVPAERLSLYGFIIHYSNPRCNLCIEKNKANACIDEESKS